MVQEDVAAAHGGEHVGLLGVVGLQARLGDRRPRRVAQLGVPGDLDDVPQVVEVEQPRHVEHVLGLDLQRLGDLLEDDRAHPGPDLDPHDIAEAPPTQLVLDRLQQVVGLVGDREVGVAGDAEDVVVDDLHAGEQPVEVLGDQILERDEGEAVAGRDEARQHLLRDLHARERLHVRHRVAYEHAERERQVGDVRERTPEADGERRQHREDLVAEAVVERAPLLRPDVVDADDPDAVVGQPRPQLELQAAALALDVRTVDLTDRLERGPRRAAVLQRRLDARLDLVVQAGHAHHEELVEVLRGDRAELHALEQGHALVLGQLEHARVELQPRQLAVEVQARGGEIDRFGRRLVIRARLAHGLESERSDNAKARRAANPLRS